METQPLLETLDPELVERLVDRKVEIEQGATAGKGIAAALAIGSVPIALAALSRDAFGQSALDPAIKNVLDFALALEIFENEFYKAVLNMSSSAAQNNAFATVRVQAQAVAGAVATLTQIQKHEAAHVATLQSLGATNVFNLSATSFDFTGNRSASGGGPFSKATTDLPFLLEVAQGAEDTGVRAYKGQAGNLISNSAILEGALRIHSVEARHAARIRRMRRLAAGAGATVRLSGTVRGGERAAAGATDLGTVNPTSVAAAFDKIYGAGASPSTAPSESNTSHGSPAVNVAALSAASFGVEAAQEAFDEPLDRADVVAIVQPFFIPTLN
jgi:hypothetical protein